MIDQPIWLSALKDVLKSLESSPESRFAQLATIDVEGRPTNRTLVFRRFTNENELVFTTDARSKKAEQLEETPWAELCWWFPPRREQFRIQGRAYLSDGSDFAEFALARSEIWNELKEAAKRSFTWPVPGQRLADSSEFLVPVPESIPPHFSLLLLRPERVDHLDLQPDPHHREIHTRDASGLRWTNERVNP